LPRLSTAPEVTIGLPVYNGANYLAEALESVLAQSYGDYEVLVADNASDDATEEICRAFAERDARVIYHRHETNLGAAYNYNFCVHQARGRFFKWLAHDDLIHRDFLKHCMALDALRPEGVAAFVPRVCWIDADGQVQRYYEPPRDWDGRSVVSRVRCLLGDREWSYLVHPYPIFSLLRTDLLRRTELIRAFYSADKLTVFQLALEGDLVDIPEYLIYRRIHPGNTVLSGRMSRSEVVAWYDPSRRPRLVTPRSGLYVEYARSIVRARLPISEKLAALNILRREVFRDSRILAGELRRALPQLVN
jgi:glycosyltransferase involved in cell wall biosynthesis